MDSGNVLAETDITKLRRKRERGTFRRDDINAILDAGLVCHVGFSDAGSPFVVPTTFARVGELLYLHGAPANHMLRSLAAGCEACVTVTMIDGLVLSRAAFHHSMNYRSVMLFGRFAPVEEVEEKRAALLATVEHMMPGRSSDVRPPSDDELRRTLVVSLPLVEGSAKIRTGGPIEEPEDLSLAVWAGQLPLRMVCDEPIPDLQAAGGDGAGSSLAGSAAEAVDPADSVVLPSHIRDYRPG